MEDSKLMVSSDGSSKMEYVPVQITTMMLNKDNYLTWSIAITIGIARRGRYCYIYGGLAPPARTDPIWENQFL